jgi:hypothetical protein
MIERKHAIQMDTLGSKVENSNVPVVSISVNLKKDDRDHTWHSMERLGPGNFGWEVSGCLWPKIFRIS